MGTPPGVVGFFIMLPMFFVLIPVIIFGPGLSLFIWRDSQLNIIKTLTLFILVTTFVFQSFDWIILLVTLYGIACISIDTQIFKNIIKRIGSSHK